MWQCKQTIFVTIVQSSICDVFSFLDFSLCVLYFRFHFGCYRFRDREKKNMKNLLHMHNYYGMHARIMYINASVPVDTELLKHSSSSIFTVFLPSPSVLIDKFTERFSNFIFHLIHCVYKMKNIPVCRLGITHNIQEKNYSILYTIL